MAKAESKQPITVTEKWDFQKSYMSVEYPGLVKNPEKAIESLGGISGISKAYCQGNRRFPLQFQPGDPFRKAIMGERVPITNLLMKIVKRTIKNKSTGETEIKYLVTVLGTITSSVKFQTMADFQYLPMQQNKTQSGSSYVSLLNQLVPEGLADLSWLETQSPFFMSPSIFSKTEIPNDYYFRKDFRAAMVPSNVIGRVRGRRTTQAIFITFDSDFVPEKPRDIALKQLPIRFVKDADVDVVRRLLDERPIWTKAGLLYHAKDIPNASMKFILAATAYHFSTGPWRNAWVRFGYDPRKDPNARIYQVLDYRLPPQYRSKVAAKRSYSEAHRLSTARAKHKELDESMFSLRPGMWPPCRQMFYQYCDLLIPEIQDLLDTAPINDTCNERTGWYSSCVEEEMRTMVNKRLQESFEESKQDALEKKAEAERLEENDEEEDADIEETNLGSSDEFSDSDG